MKKLFLAVVICATFILNSCCLQSNEAETLSFPKNRIVDNPQQNKVTTEIDKALVGKYVHSEYKDAYFEIREDGAVSCYTPYHTGGSDGGDSSSFLLLAFYEDDGVDLSFVAIDEERFLDYGLAINLYGKTEGEKFYFKDHPYGEYIRQK